MSIIDEIICDIDKLVERDSDWHVEIAVDARKSKVASKEKYSWNAGSHTAAKAIKEYLVARGMTDGVLAEPQGPVVCIAKQNQDN